MQELAIHLSQQISNVIGAAYCRVALFPANLQFAGANTASAPSGASEIVLLSVARLRANHDGQTLNGAVPQTTEPFTTGAELVARIASAGHSARPRLRFCWQEDEVQSEQACLDVCFNAPRKFSNTEISALLFLVEASRMMLKFTRLSAVRVSVAEQVAKKLQGDIFAMPFLEAKKHWIDVFEHEYLRLQMIKFFGNISKAARAARISRYTLYALLNKFQFSAQSFKRMKPQKSSLSRSATHNGRKKSEEQEVLPDMFAQLS